MTTPNVAPAGGRTVSPPSVPPQTAPTRRIKKRTGTTRERTGCLTCRQRRKKCEDNTYPICGHCRRLNLECVRESPRQLPKPSNNTPNDAADAAEALHRARSASIEITRIPDSGQLSRYADGYGTSDTRYFLKYYTQILSNLVTSNHENNSFLSVFIPMAVESRPLLNSLVAWSSAHLALFHSSWNITAIEKHSEALSSVGKSIASSHDDLTAQETNLAASLVLCSTAVVSGDTSHWYGHLVGSKHLILNASGRERGGGIVTGPKAFMNTMDGEWLLRNFAYHDVLASVTSGEEPLIKGVYWLHDNVEVVDAYVGVGSRVLGLMSEISCLKVPRIEEQVSHSELPGGLLTPTMDTADLFEDEDMDLWKKCLSLERQLQNWVCPSAVQPGLTAMAEAYRCSALIHLYRKIRRFLLIDPAQLPQNLSSPPYSLGDISEKIQAQVQGIIAQLDFISVTSLPECGLLFPLFMAGGDTTDPTHIEVIRMRLRVLKEHRGFANTERASEVLEEVWRLKSCGIKGKNGAEVDWTDVLERTGVKLMLA